MIEDNRRTDIALAEYKEVVAQFRALTDIRFRLLTYLPLGIVAGAVFVSNGSQLIDQPAVAIFALVATVCTPPTTSETTSTTTSSSPARPSWNGRISV